MPYPGLFSRRKLSGPSITCCTARSHSAQLDDSRRVDHGRPVCDCARVGRGYPDAGTRCRGVHYDRWRVGGTLAAGCGRSVGHPAGCHQTGLSDGAADEAVLWIDRAPPASQEESRVTVYLEGSAAVDFGRSGQVHANTGTAAQSIRDHSWFGRLTTRSGVDVRAPVRTDVQGVKPAVYQRGEQAWDQAASGVRQAQFTTQPSPVLPPSGLQPPAMPPPAADSQPPGVPAARDDGAATGPAAACRATPVLPGSPVFPPSTLPAPTLQPPAFSGPAETLPQAPLAPVTALGKTRAGWPAEQRPDSHQEFSRHASQSVGDGLQ